MNAQLRNLTFIGSGAIATSLGNAFAMNKELNVTLYSIEEDVVNAINSNRINQKYFPSVKLEENLSATLDKNIFQKSDVLFLAIPSSQIANFIGDNIKNIPSETILVNLAKGFGSDKQPIAICIEERLEFPVCSLKGPTFARDIINEQPSAFTLASKNTNVFHAFRDILPGTNIYIDYSTDVKGVELLSILKNIYAIATGIMDAHYDSANLRFLFLTRAFSEMRSILLRFGGKEETMFKYCGYGDFSLTALNDLSRNRTLGLLIGKGFFTDEISDKVTLEGKIAVNIFCEEISKNNSIDHYPIIQELYKVFNEPYDLSSFTGNILNMSH